MVYLLSAVSKVLKQMKEDHVGAYASQSAYFIVLSFLPFLMLILTLIQYTPLTKSDILQFMVELLPDMFDPLAINIVDEVYNKSTAIISITAITAVWSASRGLLAITNGLNSVYDAEETRGYLVLKIRSVFYTVLFIVLIICFLVLVVFGNSIHGFFIQYLPFISHISAFLIHIRPILSLGVTFLLFLLMYRFVPNRRSKWKYQIPGAAFTAIGWYVFSFGFSLYVDYFDGLSHMYGSLTTIVMIMLWLYFCMYIMLIGGEINAGFEQKTIDTPKIYGKMKK